MKKLLCFLLLLLVALNSCKKSDQTALVDPIKPKLLKITLWNTSTNVETVLVEPTYDSKNKITGIKFLSNNYVASFGANGKIATVFQTSAISSVTYSYTLEYNNLGFLSKITRVSNLPNTSGDCIITYSYNLVNQIIKITYTYPNPASRGQVANFTWNENNMATYYFDAPDLHTETNMVYDDKLNPYELIGDIYYVATGTGTPSKNNLIEVKIVDETKNGVEKRTHIYNSANYPVSMKTEGTTEGRKFYYDK